MEPNVEHEPGRFFLRVGDLEAEVLYERRGDVLDIQHTWTPPPLRGRELAARLTEAAFLYAREHGLRILPTCPYTRAWVASHPEVRGLTTDR
jgi:predicted GNAT family acetyltransferase